MVNKEEVLLFANTEEAKEFRYTKEWEILMDTYLLTYDYLPNTNIYLYQSKTMFRNNTDTGLLGNFISIKDNEKVLDIGTNNGSLLLYAAQYKPKELYGIDIQEEACTLARKNMCLHGVEATILNQALQEVELPQVDVIVCNPPYFDYEDPRIKEDKGRNVARHAITLTLEELCKHVYRLLKSKGRLYMVHRAERVAHIIHVASTYHLEVKQMQFAYAKNKEEAYSVLLELRKDANPGCKIKAPIYI